MATTIIPACILIPVPLAVLIRGWRIQLPNYQGQNDLAIITA